jgi:DNA-binding NtrC family response regulator
VQATVLLVDDDPDVLLAARVALQGRGLRIADARSPAEALARLANDGNGANTGEVAGEVASEAADEVAAVLLDLNFRRGATSGEEGLECLAAIRKRHPEVGVIVVTAHAAVDLAVAAMHQGASDFISKPWSNERLATTVANAVELHRARRAAARLAQQAAELGQPAGAPAPEGLSASHAAHGLIGRSPGIAHVRSLIERVAPTEANVLILGENGTGKELVALALHRASPRAGAPMVAVDMGALPATLFESELFGHRKGAYTDARSDRVGRIAAADGGTLFLDEIGNLPLALQPKLLAVLERRRVTPLGSNASLAVDVRVVCATNQARDALADERQFRPDLLFRLNTVEIHVPPLRQRREDIPLLAEHFAQHYSRKYGKPLRTFSEAALRAMSAHDWPGNVRALRHAVERAVVMSPGGATGRFGPEDLALAGPHVAQAAQATHRRSAIATPTNAEAEDLNLERAERQLVERALVRHAWNISLAARELGLTRASLYRRMQRHGL